MISCMLNFVKRLFRKSYTPLNLITISKEALINNYESLSKVNPEIKIAPVLKSNAYGHGIRLVGKILDEVKAPFLCVDSLYEAFQLQTKAQVRTPILIMGYVHEQSLSVKKLPFSFAIYDLTHAEVLNKFQRKAKVHIFIDTGMHREGVSMQDLPDFLRKLKKLKEIEVEGVMSHLADSSNPDSILSKMQINNFKKAITAVKEAGFKPKWFHNGGTYGLLNKLTDGSNLIRVGRAVYGIEDKPNLTRGAVKSADTLMLNLKPALKHTTKIVSIKKIKRGEKVGYSGTFTASKDMTIGILPLGYNDGVDRRLSNKGVVTVRGSLCPIIGLVSMNVTAIDLSAVLKPVLDMEAVVFSDNPDDANSVVNASLKGGLLPHEMLIHIAESTKRVVI